MPPNAKPSPKRTKTPIQALIEASAEPEVVDASHGWDRDSWLILGGGAVFLGFLAWVIFSDHWLAQAISDALLHLSF